MCQGVFEYIAGTINARSLAVPDAEYAVLLCAWEYAELLRAPYRSCSEVFIEAFPKHDVMGVEALLNGT